MERADLEVVLVKAKPGNLLRLVFKPSAGGKQEIDIKMAGILSYFGLMNNRILGINEVDVLTLAAVVESKNWDTDLNRTFIVSVLPGFDQDWFIKRLCEGLETVEIF